VDERLLRSSRDGLGPHEDAAMFEARHATESIQVIQIPEKTASSAEFLGAIASSVRLAMLQYLLVEGQATATA
jgi:hypothetical protein